MRDPELAEAIAAAHGERVVAVGRRSRGTGRGRGLDRGLRAGTRPRSIADLAERGIERFVYTPVEVDGLMEGPDRDSPKRDRAATSGELIYSGGVGSLEDLSALAALEIENLGGVIVGRALYEGRFTVAEGQAALEA